MIDFDAVYGSIFPPAKYILGEARMAQALGRPYVIFLVILALQCSASWPDHKAFGVLDLDWSSGDLPGGVATISAATAGWVETRQYATLVSAYEIANEELRAIRTLPTRER